MHSWPGSNLNDCHGCGMAAWYIGVCVMMTCADETSKVQDDMGMYLHYIMMYGIHLAQQNQLNQPELWRFQAQKETAPDLVLFVQ